MSFDEQIVINAKNNLGTISLSANAVQEGDEFLFDDIRFGVYAVTAKHTSPHFNLEPRSSENLTLTDDGFLLIVDKNYEGVNFDLEEILYKMSGKISGQISTLDHTDTAIISISGTNNSTDIFTNTNEFSENVNAKKAYYWSKTSPVRQGTYRISMTWTPYEYKYNISPEFMDVVIDDHFSGGEFTTTFKEYDISFNLMGEVRDKSDFILNLKADILGEKQDLDYVSGYVYDTPLDVNSRTDYVYNQGLRSKSIIKAYPFKYDMSLKYNSKKYNVVLDSKFPELDVRDDMTINCSATLKKYSVSGTAFRDQDGFVNAFNGYTLKVKSRGYVTPFTTTDGVIKDGTLVTGGGRSYTLVIYGKDGTRKHVKTYDVYGDTTLAQSKLLAQHINHYNDGEIFIIQTMDEPQSHRDTPELISAIESIGGNKDGIFSGSGFSFRSAYALIGKKGGGTGSGIEMRSESVDNSTFASVEIEVGVINGNIIDINHYNSIKNVVDTHDEPITISMVGDDVEYEIDVPTNDDGTYSGEELPYDDYVVRIDPTSVKSPLR
jgi:hypothetical protein